MSRNYNGGTDQIHWYDNIESVDTTLGYDTISLWMKTTDTTGFVQIWGLWNSSTRYGPGITMNRTANKISFLGLTGINASVDLVSTTSINDGNWHHVCAVTDRNNASLDNLLYIDGVQEANAASSTGAWYSLVDNYVVTGDSLDAGWSPYTGDLAEVAHWSERLSADEVAALAKGFSPKHIRPQFLDHYAPLVREVTNIITPTNLTPAGVSLTTGTTVSDHPRVYG